MKYINELKEGERVESVFAVSEKSLRITRAGKAFLALKLSDKTGSVDAVIWDNAEAHNQKFVKGDFLGIRGDVSNYQGTLQLTIQTLKKVEQTPEYIERFVATTDRDVDGLAGEVAEIVAGIKSPKVRELINNIFGDPGFMAAFKAAPAAKGIHHAFSGGLIQHTLKVARLCEIIYKEYSETDPKIAAMINRDILIAGALLHDIGKMEELTPGPTFDFTKKGRLLGHVSLGLLTLKARMDEVEGFPEDAAELLMHMVLSHHGELEYGAPKRPKCLEAFILHYADNLDAKLQGLMEFAGKDLTEGDFTAYNKLYERYFYKGRPEMGEGE
ncbi:MAG: HD domain-containing protein [Nitrospirae bacterium]|nr:HD domain-containing protein [Nitrospirota bacterium]